MIAWFFVKKASVGSSLGVLLHSWTLTRFTISNMKSFQWSSCISSQKWLALPKSSCSYSSMSTAFLAGRCRFSVGKDYWCLFSPCNLCGACQHHESYPSGRWFPASLRWYLTIKMEGVFSASWSDHLVMMGNKGVW